MIYHPIGPMNFINNDPDHIEVLESKITSPTTNANSTTTEVYSFNGKLIISHVINSISDKELMAQRALSDCN